MKIKQARCYRLHESFEKKSAHLEEKMNEFLFSPCSPASSTSMGWVPPIADEDGLSLKVENYFIFCLQIEEKILPASVIRQHLLEAIKQTEMSEHRKLGQKERDRLKDEIIYTLLPRAFSKLTKIYLYVDVKHNWLVINSSQTKRVESVLIALKKTFEMDCQPLIIPQLGKLLTYWLRDHQCPIPFSVENACVLQDPRNIARVIRCKTQNLFSRSILDLVQDGCEIKQVLLSWQDKMDFVLHDDMSLTSVTVKHDELSIVEDQSDSPRMKFFSDFMLYSSVVSPLLFDLVEACQVKEARQASAA